MWYILPILVLVGALAYEYRLRRPDQLILFDAAGTIGFRRVRWYPRHFSLALPGTTYPMELNLDATAKGGIPIVVKLALSIAASRNAIASLVRVGGWNIHAVEKAAKELATALHGQVKQLTETLGLEDVTSDRLRDALMQQAEITRTDFGVDIVSMTVQSIDAVDPSIAEALRQRESARIKEQTEELRQLARVAEAHARTKADDQIRDMEHAVELKKLALKRKEQEEEAHLAEFRTEEELKRNRMRLAFDKEEINILKDNPALLLLTPQAARLAEASQSLRNAKTVISLSPSEAEQGTKLAGIFQLFLENYLNTGKSPKDKK